MKTTHSQHLSTFVIYKGFHLVFAQLQAGPACEPGERDGHGRPPRGTWARATPREPDERMVRPLPYEKQADRTSSSGLRKISTKLNLDTSPPPLSCPLSPSFSFLPFLGLLGSLSFIL